MGRVSDESRMLGPFCVPYGEPYMNRRWYRIENAASQEADIFIYDVIAFYGVTADQFVKDLAKVTAKTINVRINSPGGDVFDGMAIFNALRRHDAKVVSHIDGLAASIASVIALAGEEVHIADNAFFMIHNPFALTIGTAAELRKTADVLDKVGGQILNIYRSKTGKTDAEIQQWMDSETWFNSGEAKVAGFIDNIVGGGDVQDAFNLSQFQFKHIPEPIAARARKRAPSHDDALIDDIRDFESFLRDEGGFSHAAAKRIAAAGFRARSEPRDEDDALLELRNAIEKRGQAFSK